MQPLSEWNIPPLPIVQSNFISSNISEPLQLTCACSNDSYIFVGSQGGGLWILDIKTGKVLNSWQAHDGPILKV
jgi:hypothetical protein